MTHELAFAFEHLLACEDFFLGGRFYFAQSVPIKRTSLQLSGSSGIAALDTNRRRSKEETQ